MTKHRKTRYAGVYWSGNSLIISWSVNGRRFWEGAPDMDENAANVLRAKRIIECSEGTYTAPQVAQITFKELFDDLLREYLNEKRKSHDSAKGIIDRHLDPFFGYRRVVAVTSAEFEKYKLKRYEDGVKSGTIRGELALVSSALHKGFMSGKVKHIPPIKLPKKSTPRSGFYTREEVESLCSHLPAEIVPLVWFAYITGWRLHEVMWLNWRHVDFAAHEVRLFPGETKNERGRVFPMTEDLERLLLEQSRRRVLECPYVFHRDGKQIKSFRDAFNFARKKAGLANRLFHDFRRTAVSNSRRAGVPEKEAMQAHGHETRAIFDNYNIVNEDDMKDAAKKMNAFAERRK